MIMKILGSNVCERKVFSRHKSIYRSGELNSTNKDVTVIISHDLERVEQAPPATVQAGKTEPVNTVKRKLGC